jgi:hypothetical protein
VKTALRLAIVALMLVVAQVARAQQPTAANVDSQPVILVVDISGSMSDTDSAGTRKIDGAKLALLDYIGNIESGSLVGLRTYPDQEGGGCNSGKRVIGVGPVNPREMSAQVRGLQPDGDTPTAEAMKAAAKDLKDSGYARGTLVIVSDGESTCGDPCQAAREIAGSGIGGGAGFDLDAITVGFQISDEGRKQLQCISDALKGRYLDADQSDELRDTLDRLGRPRIEVRLDGSATPTVDAGGDQLEISATVTNTGEFEARNMIGQLSFGSAAIDVLRPVARLGNLAPQASRVVKWRVRAPASSAGKSFAFSVVGRAANATTAGEAKGTLKSIGITEADQAGAILKGPGSDLVVLGDSYSAGEGADEYDPRTDSDYNGCHRSPSTYLIPKFRGSSQLFACSGAVAANIAAPNYDQRVRPRGGPEPAQTARLAQLQRPGGGKTVKAAVMTIGGNDAQFPTVARSCIIGTKTCTDRIQLGLPLNPVSDDVASKTYEDRLLGGHALQDEVERTYEQVNAVINAKDVAGRRGGVAPILVLAYPLPIPITGRTCAPMGFYIVPKHVQYGTPPLSIDTIVPETKYLLTASEINFVFNYGTRLNGVVESAVLTARDHGVPVFYVPTTELAFLPSHTVCDTGKRNSATEPFARSLLSFNGGALNGATLAKLTSFDLLKELRGTGDVVKRGIQELAHPNKAGYSAVTSAVLRWSRTQAGRDAEAFVKSAKPVDPAPTSWRLSDVNLGQIQQGQVPVLQGGTGYPLTVGGFLPGSQIRIEVHSEPRLLAIAGADQGGRVDTRVGIPRDLDDGRHTLVVSGVDARNRPRAVRIAFEIDRPFRPSLVTSIAGLSAIALVAGLVLTLVTGQLGRWRRRVRGSAASPGPASVA